jgi:chemotaxis protein methyltransferase CheR
MKPPVHPASVVMLLAHMVEERSGIHYAGRELEIFEGKVSARAAEAGFESLLDYYYLLRYDDLAHTEIDLLIEALVVGETYFFREAAALGALVETMEPPASKRLRIWSAACATGEEAVTLAILLERAGLSTSVDIVATDISVRALERARRGEYGPRAHRSIPEGVEPWIRIVNGRAVVDERIRASIDWRQINLTDRAAVLRLGSFDAIVCRNVLIYFSDKTVAKVADNLAQALGRGGRLLVGATESLMRLGTTFGCEERGGAFLYRHGPP